MFIMEIWKPVPGFSRYEVSSLGQIRSMSYQNMKIIKELKPAPDNYGYLKTMLKRDDGKYCTIAIHRIIAITFLGEKPSPLHQVNHKNGDKSNNSIDNLEYCTKIENIRHAWANGLCGSRSGSNNSQSILTESQVLEIRAHAKKHGHRYGNKELAQKYGVSRDLIQRIVNRRMWKHI
jgi:hypothetical protein